MRAKYLSLAACIPAIGISAFAKFAITENFLVQSDLNVFTRAASNPMPCITPATMFCHYQVTEAGKANIPAKSSYTPADINTYLSNGWVNPPTGTIRSLYAK